LDFVVETERLTGGYGSTMVLHALSLQVPRASIFGFLGPNGAGKTTAIRMLLGLLQPVSGEVRLFGRPLRGALPGILRRVGSLIEQPSLYEHLTGKENLEIIRRLKGLARRDVDQAIEALDIGDYAGNPVEEYSRGMRQRLGWLLIVIHTWISVRFPGFAVPAGIAFAAMLIGAFLVAVNRDLFGWWYPWTLAISVRPEGLYDPHSTIAPALFGACAGMVLAPLASWDLGRRLENI
jgi:ABC-type transport system involved in cytochrome c biogenesis ATPase subunit